MWNGQRHLGLAQPNCAYYGTFSTHMCLPKQKKLEHILSFTLREETSFFEKLVFFYTDLRLISKEAMEFTLKTLNKEKDEEHLIALQSQTRLWSLFQLLHPLQIAAYLA